jgi:hypothetical protein
MPVAKGMQVRLVNRDVREHPDGAIFLSLFKKRSTTGSWRAGLCLPSERKLTIGAARRLPLLTCSSLRSLDRGFGGSRIAHVAVVAGSVLLGRGSDSAARRPANVTPGATHDRQPQMPRSEGGSALPTPMDAAVPGSVPLGRGCADPGALQVLRRAGRRLAMRHCCSAGSRARHRACTPNEGSSSSWMVASRLIIRKQPAVRSRC